MCVFRILSLIQENYTFGTITYNYHPPATTIVEVCELNIQTRMEEIYNYVYELAIKLVIGIFYQALA